MTRFSMAVSTDVIKSTIIAGCGVLIAACSVGCTPIEPEPDTTTPPIAIGGTPPDIVDLGMSTTALSTPMFAADVMVEQNTSMVVTRACGVGSHTDGLYHSVDLAPAGEPCRSDPLVTGAAGDAQMGSGHGFGNWAGTRFAVTFDNGAADVYCFGAHGSEPASASGAVQAGDLFGMSTGNTGNVTGLACAKHPGLHLHEQCVWLDGSGAPVLDQSLAWRLIAIFDSATMIEARDVCSLSVGTKVSGFARFDTTLFERAAIAYLAQLTSSGSAVEQVGDTIPFRTGGDVNIFYQFEARVLSDDSMLVLAAHLGQRHRAENSTNADSDEAWIAVVPPGGTTVNDWVPVVPGIDTCNKSPEQLIAVGADVLGLAEPNGAIYSNSSQDWNFVGSYAGADWLWVATHSLVRRPFWALRMTAIAGSWQPAGTWTALPPCAL